MKPTNHASAPGTRTRRAGLPARLAAAGLAIAAVPALSGCGTSEPEAEPGTVVEIEDVRLDAIRDVAPDGNLEYKRVTVPGEVDTVISPAAFSISDPGEPQVEPLLIVHKDDVAGAEPEARVSVTGVVYRGFDVPAVEKETGLDLDDALYEEWQGDSYIVASEVTPQ